MGPNFPSALAIAAALFVLPPSGIAQARNTQSNQSVQNAVPSMRAHQEAAKMVSATAVFTSPIDSQKLSTGSQFEAKLQKKVQLEGGPELPAGTILDGRIANDSQSAGQAQLALRFTEAKLKDGQTVPIKATIVDVYQVPDWAEASQYGVVTQPVRWDHKTMAVDQISVISGVDLHSNIASPNSGVFVSTKKDDIKLSRSLGVELAIAARGTTGESTMSGSAGS